MYLCMSEPYLGCSRQVPKAAFDAGGAVRRQLHFGANIAAIFRGMRQREVARLFARECMCARAYDAQQGVDLVLHWCRCRRAAFLHSLIGE